MTKLTASLVIFLVFTLISVHMIFAQELPTAVYLPFIGEAKPATATSTPTVNIDQSITPLFTQTPVVHDERYEDNHAALSYTGVWTELANSNASGGTYKVSSSSDNTVAFTFMGNNLIVFRKLDTLGGVANAQIDRKQYEINFSFLEERWQVPAIFDNLGEGAHTMTLTLSSVDRPIYIDALGVIQAYTPDPDQVAALNRVNYHRQLAGLTPVTGAYPLHQTAQKHVEYLLNQRWNPRHAGLNGHNEYPDLTGYFGETADARAQYYGYSGGVSEVISGGSPTHCVDSLMAAPYHRNTLLQYAVSELGYGAKQDPHSNGQCVMLLGAPTNESIAPNQRVIYTYPSNEQTEVPTDWNAYELPEPLPGVARPVGYPISLYLVQPSSAAGDAQQAARQQRTRRRAWDITLAELTNAQGQAIPTYLLHHGTDSLLIPDIVFLIAKSPLTPDTVYTAHIAGSDSQGVAFDYQWSFQTTKPTQGTCNTIPRLIFPPDGSQVNTVRKYFRWHLDDNPLITEFHLEVATSRTFEQIRPSLTAFSPNTGEAHIELNFDGDFPPASTYFWRTYVKCGDQQGAYSTTAKFTTGSNGVILPAPTIIAPADHSALLGTTVNIEWTSIPGAIEYYIELRPTDAHLGPLEAWVTHTKATIGYLHPNTLYNLHIKAVNEYAYGQPAVIQLSTGPGVVLTDATPAASGAR